MIALEHTELRDLGGVKVCKGGRRSLSRAAFQGALGQNLKRANAAAIEVADYEEGSIQGTTIPGQNPRGRPVFGVVFHWSHAAGDPQRKASRGRNSNWTQTSELVW